jgi:hypothetical protein
MWSLVLLPEGANSGTNGPFSTETRHLGLEWLAPMPGIGRRSTGRGIKRWHRQVVCGTDLAGPVFN